MGLFGRAWKMALEEARILPPMAQPVSLAPPSYATTIYGQPGQPMIVQGHQDPYGNQNYYYGQG